MRSRNNGARWVLAFDASCGHCRAVSDVVERACDGKLEVLPLTHPGVRRWRERAMGAEPPWAPTLIKICDENVQAWTGLMMGARLVERLGLRSTVRLLRGLGELRTADSSQAKQRRGPILDRKGFLRLGTGLGAAAGLVLAGRTPAFGDTDKAEQIRAWVEANRNRLPERYEEFVAHPCRTGVRSTPNCLRKHAADYGSSS